MQKETRYGNVATYGFCMLSAVVITASFITCLSCATTPTEKVGTYWKGDSKIALCSQPELVLLPSTAEPFYDVLTQAAVEAWNNEIGYEVLFFGGRAPLDPETRKQPFMIIAPASVERIAKWDAREKYRGSVTRMAGLSQAWVLERTKEPDCIVGSSIWLRDTGEYSVGKLYKILLHEMGHGIGLTDRDDPGCVMHGYVYHKEGVEVPFMLGEGAMKELRSLYPPEEELEDGTKKDQSGEQATNP